MAWIKTISMAEANEDLRRAMETQRALYPVEYATPVHAAEEAAHRSSSHTALSPKLCTTPLQLLVC